jgi:hypothetical protein
VADLVAVPVAAADSAVVAVAAVPVAAVVAVADAAAVAAEGDNHVKILFKNN